MSKITVMFSQYGSTAVFDDKQIPDSKNHGLFCMPISWRQKG